MTQNSSSDLMMQFKDWMSNPAISKNLGSHVSVVRNVMEDLLGQHALLQKNSKTRPSIAIFGPSQAGKSYLTAKICERSDETVSVKIDKDYDFLREINPKGGKESTALVTRMTTHKDTAKRTAPNTVHASLLSIPDLIGIFVNIYCCDLKQSNDLSRDVIASRIESVCGKDILDQVHTTDNWVDPSLVYLRRVLGYLPIDLRPYTDLLRLPNGFLEGKRADQLTELFSPMWGDISELSALFEHLCGYLIQLKFASSIQIPVEAFVPREMSIIDVAVLSSLQDTDSYSDLSIEVMTHSSDSVDLPRPILCALISEVEFVLNSPKTSLLGSVDILDFPGARSRIRRDIQQYEEGGVDKLFLRGKISHLFEAASSRDEIDTLLLCVKPGPMDVATLPDTIGRWINGVAESQISRRLFILATKFDELFPAAAGQSKDDQEKFDNAIFSSVLEPFAATEDAWFHKFKFKNIFPIRNPNYPYDGFFIYDKQSGQEIRLRDDIAERIEELRRAFAGSKSVTSYVDKIPEKWNSLMSPGDGGAFFLINELAAVNWKALKEERLTLKQQDLFKQVVSLLEPFAIHDDVSKKLQQEKQKFLAHFVQLQQLVDKRNLASFAELFAISPLDLKASVSSDILSGDEEEEVASQVSGVQVPSFLRGELPEESKAGVQSSKEKFFEKLVSALLVALLEELDNNVKNCDKNLISHQETMTYFASHFTSEYQLEKLKQKLMTLSVGWTTGLKLTDNLDPICMVVSRVFDDHFYGFVEDDMSAGTNIVANPIISHFAFADKPSGNVSFFNAWMNHVGKIIEDNVSNASGGGHDLTVNNELLLLLDKAQNYLDGMSA